MGKMLQIRNIPPELHAELYRRAKEANKSLTEYVQKILEREVSKPPREEIFERVKSREPVALPKRASEYLAEARKEAV